MINLYKRIMDNFLTERSDVVWVSEKPQIGEDVFLYSSIKSLIGSKNIDDLFPMNSEFKKHEFNYDGYNISFSHLRIPIHAKGLHDFIAAMYRNNPNNWK